MPYRTAGLRYASCPPLAGLELSGSFRDAHFKVIRPDRTFRYAPWHTYDFVSGGSPHSVRRSHWKMIYDYITFTFIHIHGYKYDYVYD